MPEIQFIHLEGFGRTPRKGKASWCCIDGVTREGARVPGHHPHVPFPSEPTILHGISPVDAGRLATERSLSARDALGRRLRTDAVALISGVVSYPVPRDVMAEDELIRHLYVGWRHESVEWLKKEYGSPLKSVVEHSDEKFFHLHYYAVPELGPNGRLLEVHPGRAAVAEAIRDGGSKRAQRAAAVAAMQAFQDRFHAEVSIRWGHERHGPRRARKLRKEQLLERRVEEIRRKLNVELTEKLTALEHSINASAIQQYSWPLEQARQWLDQRAAEIRLAQMRVDQLQQENEALRGRLRELEADDDNSFGEFRI